MMRTLPLAAILLCLACLAFAPAPMHRQSRERNRSLSETLPGEWVMRWGGSPYHLTLERGGGYYCKLGSINYVGSWSVDGHGRFRIIESTRAEDANSWRSYCVRFEPGTLAGHEEASKVEVRLERFTGPRQP